MPRRKPIGEKPATRSSRTKLLDDPDQRERELNAQLKSMSLYASQTSGDGNCLFRALSDQLYGHPDQHFRLRHEICDYLAASPERFAGFVDIEKTFEEYVRTMRQNGTYGGHLELSAFASLKKKEIKIVQPGLVYIVSGDDDSSQAVAERQAIEERRQRIQDSLPPGSEGPPPSSREQRRRKRLASKSVGPASSRDTTEEPMSTPDAGNESDQRGEVSSSATLSTDSSQSGSIEAYGPLYIAYHNWEHYSSVRNVGGPHTGLPRIIESNISLASQQSSKASPSKGKARHTDDEVEEYSKPTEHEELILRSAPGHTLQEVRFLLKQHGNLWESVVEVLIAQDNANEDGRAKSSATLGCSPPGPMTRSRAPSHTYGGALSPRQQPRSVASTGTAHHFHQGHPKAPLPEHLREWRGDSPSASSSGGDAGSASTHGTTSSSAASADETLSAVTSQTDSTDATLLSNPSSKVNDGVVTAEGSRPRGSNGLIGVKRAASKDLMPLDGDERSPKRRSSSRERERDEKLVDGALASHFDSAASTKVAGEISHANADTPGSTQPISTDSNVSDDSTAWTTTPAGADSRRDYVEPRAARARPLNLEDDDLAAYYSTRRRVLSPPLSPDAIASQRSDVASMTAKDKREWELKKKRDRQRERRALARRHKDSRGASGGGKRGTVVATTAPPALSKKQASARQRAERRDAEDEKQRSSDVPKGFVELKI